MSLDFVRIGGNVTRLTSVGTPTRGSFKGPYIACKSLQLAATPYTLGGGGVHQVIRCFGNSIPLQTTGYTRKDSLRA